MFASQANLSNPRVSVDQTGTNERSANSNVNSAVSVDQAGAEKRSSGEFNDLRPKDWACVQQPTQHRTTKNSLTLPY